MIEPIEVDAGPVTVVWCEKGRTQRMVYETLKEALAHASHLLALGFLVQLRPKGR